MNELFSYPLLTFLIAFPLGGAVLCGVSKRSAGACRWIALMTAAALLALACLLFLAPSRGTAWLLREDYPWIESLGIRFTLGLDGISLLMVLLTALLVAVAVLVSWSIVKEKAALYFSLILVLEAGLMGVFLALDLFLFYVFWEIMLIPTIFLMIVWGADSLRAVLKFVFFTLSGSLLMLLSIISLYYLHGEQTGTFSFALESLRMTSLSGSLEFWIYLGFLLAFAVKIPLVPLHVWLPDAYCRAPTAITLLLAGVLAKTGVYGLYRFGFQLCPEAAAKSFPWLAVVALVSVFYTAWTAFAQNDVKRLLAYSSVSHLGLIVFGLTTWNRTAMEGSFLQMFNHGITLGALFAMTAMIEERIGDTGMDRLGGLWGRAPVWSFFFLVTALASLGLPGLNNFVGEILILAGAFNSQPLLGALAVPSILLAAAYMLRLVQNVLWGKSPAGLIWTEANAREVLILVPLLVLIVWVGCYPQTFLNPLQDVMGLPLAGGLAGVKGGLP